MGFYSFALALNYERATESERTIEFVDSIYADVITATVTSSFGWAELVPGTYNVTWFGMKVSDNYDDATVEDSSLTVVCTRKSLQ